MSLIVDNISKEYNKKKIISDIQCTIPEGTIVGFLGQNGAGKTTTIKIIAGILNPTSGSIYFKNKNIKNNDLNYKKSIGYLSENNPLYGDMYVWEYLNFIATIHSIPDKKKSIQSIIEQMSLGQHQNKKINTLSKGNKQRVGIAAAFIHNPDLLLLDEPTSGLDPTQSMEIRKLISSKAENKIVFFSSHLIAEVEAVCDRIIIIHKGKIISDTPILELKKNSSKQKFSIQFEQNYNFSLFENMPDIESFQLIGKNKISFIAKENMNILKQAILQFSLENNFNIVSIDNATIGLEQYFNESILSAEMHLS